MALDPSAFLWGLEDIALHVGTNCGIERPPIAVADG